MTEERWAELYRLEFPRLYRALLAVLRDRDRALDALHDAFVAGLRHPPAHDADLAGWLFVVAIAAAVLSSLSPRSRRARAEKKAGKKKPKKAKRK